MIIVNADDLGRSRAETDLTLSCYKNGRVTSATAMVFMEDSVRAAELAKQAGLNCGLHLNLNESFQAEGIPSEVNERHERVVNFFKRSKYTQLLYNPLLRGDIAYIYEAQVAEFARLYGVRPTHIDGHHHMHLCVNILLDGVIPKGLKVRRTFSSLPGERTVFNRFYRGVVSRILRKRYIVTDYFFSLGSCLARKTTHRVLELAKYATVEVMTHVCAAPEETYLTSDEYWVCLRGIRKGSYSELRAH